MEKTINEELNRALEVLARYHPEADDALGGLQLGKWKRSKPRKGKEFSVYQDALLTVGVFAERSGGLSRFKYRIVITPARDGYTNRILQIPRRGLGSN